jgi:hypothetical protein
MQAPINVINYFIKGIVSLKLEKSGFQLQKKLLFKILLLGSLYLVKNCISTKLKEMQKYK